jgi:hypothetical protein
MFTDVMDRNNVRVIERRCHLRFALKSASRLWISEIIRKQFDRDGSLESGVQSAVNFAHSSRTDRIGDFVLSEFGSLQRLVNRSGEAPRS